MISTQIQQALWHLKSQGLYRNTREVHRDAVLSFCSNDYLSARQNEHLRQAFMQGFKQYPVGSGASPVVSGFHESHRLLEDTIADYLGVKRALLFSSGYAANLGMMTLLRGLKRPLLLDKGVHASIYDGLQLSAYIRYSHMNMADLQAKLVDKTGSVIITESLFSMSGQQPDLNSMATLAKQHQSVLVVDEAHAFGVIGPQGLGAVHQAKLPDNIVPLRMLAFGKAMGGQGAVVAGDEDWIDYLYQIARSHIYSTAMSPAIAYGLHQAFLWLTQADEERARLFKQINYFREAISTSPLTWRHGLGPVQQLQIGCPHKAVALAEYLKKHDILCLAMREPTVAKKETGLRVVINAHHTDEQIDRLLKLIDNFPGMSS